MLWLSADALPELVEYDCASAEDTASADAPPVATAEASAFATAVEFSCIG